jgi:uncharacterized oxidoreductase
MDLSGNTVLITGGGSGIGLALAERFVSAGSDVIICGRRADVLDRAKGSRARVHTRVCDVSQANERIELAAWATREFPALNILVNNAGIQRRLALAEDEPWSATHEELAANLEAPIHLSRLFIPHLRERPRPSIINVTSGLAFAPLAATPVYCASKAALHSFTLSLRRQLADTPIRVVEILPPAVDTDLGGPGLHTFGIPIAELMDGVIPRLEQGELEIAHGFAAQSSQASRGELDAMFDRMNAARR